MSLERFVVRSRSASNNRFCLLGGKVARHMFVASVAGPAISLFRIEGELAAAWQR